MLEIMIPMPALSVNHSHLTTKQGRRIKTTATRKYEQSFSTCLVPYMDEIVRFLKHFDPAKSGIMVEYEFYFHERHFYTKKHQLNTRIPDVDNLIKITQDLIFSNIVNDSYIVELSARKMPTKGDAYILASIDLCPLPKPNEGYRHDPSGFKGSFPLED